MSIQLQTRKQGSRMLDPWDDDDVETPRKFSLSVDSDAGGASQKKQQRSKQLRTASSGIIEALSKSNASVSGSGVHQRPRGQPAKPVPAFDDRENQPEDHNRSKDPVGAQWIKHNKSRQFVGSGGKAVVSAPPAPSSMFVPVNPNSSAIRSGDLETTDNGAQASTERRLSAETLRTQQQLGQMMSFFHTTSGATGVLSSAEPRIAAGTDVGGAPVAVADGQRIAQGAGDADENEMGASHHAIYREIQVKPWSGGEQEAVDDDYTDDDKHDGRSSSSDSSEVDHPVVAVVSRTVPRHHPALEQQHQHQQQYEEAEEQARVRAQAQLQRDSSPQLKRLRAELEAERSRATAAEGMVNKLTAQMLQSSRVAQVSNAPERHQHHRGGIRLHFAEEADAITHDHVAQERAQERHQLQVMRGKNSDLELLVQDLMRENQELRNQQEEFMSTYQHDSDRRGAAEAAAAVVESLRAELEQQRRHFLEAEQQQRQREAEVAKQHKEELHRQLDKLNQSYAERADLQAAVEMMAKANAADRVKCQELEGKTAAQVDAADEAQALNQKLLKQQQQARDRCSTLELRLAEAERKAADAAQQADSSQRRADNLSVHLTETKAAYTKLMSRVADLEEFNSRSEAQAAVIGGLQQQLIDTKQRLFAEEKRSTDLEVHCRELMSRVKVLADHALENHALSNSSNTGGAGGAARDLSASTSGATAQAATAGEVLALRRQVQILTRQVTELEDSNAKLALIKTSQVRLPCSHCHQHGTDLVRLPSRS
jgi:hypothetical protein